MIPHLSRWMLLVLLGLFSLTVLAASHGTLLDRHFAELREAPDEQSARAIEQQIWKLWMASGNAEVDQLMQQALEARRWGIMTRRSG